MPPQFIKYLMLIAVGVLLYTCQHEDELLEAPPKQSSPIAEIEAVIGRSSNIQDVRNHLLHRYPNNPTRVFLNELFEQYINLSR